MELLEKTEELCRLYGIKPARSKGQNFLINEEVYDAVVVAAELRPDDLVLEVGPGLGFLTAKLAQKAGKVVAVELDDKLAAYLKTAIKTQNLGNVEIINRDILSLSLNLASETKYKIVANLPYNISSKFLRKFLTTDHRPDLLVLLLQKEVAERIVAKPGEMSLLALSVQFYAEAEIVREVPSKDFYPAPEVQSAVIKIKTRPKHVHFSQIEEKKFFQLAKFGFSAKRKMLKNNLSGGFHISTAEAQEKIENIGLAGKIRAEDLSVAEWLELYKQFYS